jgi:anti-sigma factor RsiW
VAKQEQHLTTARLSALIDRQLSAEEQAQSEVHLQTCTVCQQQLAELRQTVALLHALPQPTLPRSFTLTTAEATTQFRVNTTAHRLAPITPLPRRSGWPTYVNGAIRVVSTLAALVGIVFLLSSLFGTVIGVGGGASGGASAGVTSSSSSGIAKTSPARKPQVVTPHIQGTATQGATVAPTDVTEPPVTHPNKNENGTTQQNQFQPLLTIFDIDMAGSRALLGIALLVLGIIGFVIVTRRM